MRLTVSPLHSGGIIANWECSASCRHCLYRCNPGNPKDYISSEQSQFICNKLKELGCRSIHIGGGEPFLNFNQLVDLTQHINEAELDLEYIETNASWCVEPDEARQKIDTLLNIGVETILISIDPFHVEYIPLSRPFLLLDLCREAGMKTFIWQEQFLEQLKALDTSKTYTRDELENILGHDYIADTAHRYSLSFGGNALQILKEYGKPIPIETLLLSSSPCRELVKKGHFHVDLYGMYIPPYCTGFGIPLEKLPGPLEAEAFPLISMLSEGGISAFFEHAAVEGFIPHPDGYRSKCELCDACRRFLISKGCTSPELHPDFYYRIVQEIHI